MQIRGMEYRLSAPAPPGSAGGWGSIWARPANGSGSRAPSGRCPSSPRPWPWGSCRTPRSAPSPAWPPRRPKRGCWYQRARAEEMAIRPADLSGDLPTPAQQRADALVLLAETALHHGLDPGAPGERYQVVVHVDAQALSEPAQPSQSVVAGIERHASGRFRGNVPAPGVRCQSGRHAARRRGTPGGDRGPDPHDSSGPAAGAPPSRPGLSVPRLRRPLRRGASSPPLGPWRPDNAARPSPHRTDGVCWLARGATESGVSDRRPAPSGPEFETLSTI